MKIETKFDLGDSIYFVGYYGKIGVKCPCCNGVGVIVGCDNSEYICPKCNESGTIGDGPQEKGIFRGLIKDIRTHTNENKTAFDVQNGVKGTSFVDISRSNNIFIGIPHKTGVDSERWYSPMVTHFTWLSDNKCFKTVEEAIEASMYAVE